MELKKKLRRIDYFPEKSDNKSGMTIFVEELLDSAYGNYVWPSALVLSQFVWYHQNLFKNATILEVGAGTSLPSLVLANLRSCHLIITDIPSISPVAKSCLALNGIATLDSNGVYISSDLSVWVHALEWGNLGSVNSIDRLLADMGAQWPCNKVDYILGSDTFYNPPDFEKLLMTVAYVIYRHNRHCKFITAYQERSSKRSIQYLLDKWSLKCRLISSDSFDFDESRFTGDNCNFDYEHDDDSDDDKTTGLKDNDKGDRIPHIKVNAGTLASVFILEISAKPENTSNPAFMSSNRMVEHSK